MANAYGEGIPIPNVIDPPESFAVTLCIPKNAMHVAAFFGALYQLTTWTSWERNGTNDGKLVADVWWRYYNSWDTQITDIECEDGNMDCCTEPAIIRRVNPETGMYEQSTNNGATWQPAAGTLIGYITEPIPPVTNGVAATKCDAATNVRGQVEDWISQVSNDFDTATSLLEFAQLVVLAIVGAVLTVLTAGALTAVEAAIIAAMGAALIAMWTAGKAVFDAYWSTENKDKVLCAAFCNIGDDGSFTDAQFAAFWGDCNADLPPSPAKMLFMGFLSSVGRQGANAMAASGMEADADCSDCVECITCAQKWKIRLGGDPSLGIITEVGDDYLIAETTTAQPNGVYYISLVTGDGEYTNCCYINSVEVLTGSATVNIGVPCNDNGVPRSMLLPACMWWIEPQSNVPFSVRINIGECP